MNLTGCPRKWGVALIGFIVLVCCVRNLPWHLDDYDQAKQAYVSFEMIGRGRWLLQHTPMQRMATKPPLAGWISAGLYKLTGCWDLAWRLPSLLSAIVLLGLLWREGGWLAGAIFGLNAFTPRLATMVRTDMLLCLWLTLIGWLVYRQIGAGRPWKTSERYLLFGCVLASMLTKGPILLAFLLPGLVAFLFLKRDARPFCAWWVWVLPLLLFGFWALWGIWSDPAFFQQVVLREFAGRFDASAGAAHDPKPVYIYLAKLLPMMGPWSWLALALPFVPAARRAIAQDRQLLWLVCWAVGGLLLMSMIPSKRADRIFPIVPPLALLLARVLPLFPHGRRLVAGALAVSLLATGGYTAWNLVESYRSDGQALVRFGQKARELGRSAQLVVVRGKDEGLLLYTNTLEFTAPKEARRLWGNGLCDAMVLPEAEWKKEGLPGAKMVLGPLTAPGKNGCYVFVRRESTALSLLE